MPTISWTWASELLRKEFLWLRLACKEQIWVRSKDTAPACLRMSRQFQLVSHWLFILETSGGYWKQHYSFPLPDMQVLGRNHIHLHVKVRVLLNYIVDIQTVVTGAVEATLTRSTTSAKAALLGGTNAVGLAMFSSNVQPALKRKHRQARIAHHLLAKKLRAWNWCQMEKIVHQADYWNMMILPVNFAEAQVALIANIALTTRATQRAVPLVAGGLRHWDQGLTWNNSETVKQLKSSRIVATTS